jgi:hypothetical protein
VHRFTAIIPVMAKKRKNPAAVALGRLGGAANLGQSRPNNGMANPAVLAKAHKALALARLKNKSRKSQNTA